MYSALDGYEFEGPYDAQMWTFHERMRRDMAPHAYLLDLDDETRQRMLDEEHRRRREDEVISVMLHRAEGVEQRGEAERLVTEHHLDQQLPAMRSLAQSRGVDLEAVLRAMLRGELRSIVELPPHKEASA